MIDIGPSLHVWRSGGRGAFAPAHRRGAQWIIDVPGIAAFSFGLRGAVVAHPHRGAGARQVRETFGRGIRALALQARGTEVLHASAVVVGDGVVGFCGRSGVGKSTLAYALALRGHPVWADDSLPFRSGAGRIRAVGADAPIRLTKTSAFYFARSCSGKQRVVLAAAGPGVRRRASAASRPLHALCVIGRRPANGGRVEVRRLAPAHALLAVLPHALCLEMEERARKARMIQAYLDLSREVPVFAVRFGGGLEHLNSLLDVVERLTSPARQTVRP